MADQPSADNGAATLTAQYEQLRQVALTGQAEGRRHGLGVLTARGMTGWMRVCQTIPPPSPTTPRRVGVAHSVTAATKKIATEEIVAVMAAMALAHLSSEQQDST